MKMNSDILKVRQEMPLEVKINLSLQRIKSWYDHYHGNVYVAFSGGKDSTVLLDLVREYYPHVPAVFVDTGLEYPEIRDFVKTIDNVVWLKPEMNFKKVIETYGYPVVSKSQSAAIYRYRKNPEKNKWRLEKQKSKGYIAKKWRFLLDAPFKISDYCCDHLKKNPLKKYAKKHKRTPIIGIMADESHARQFLYLQRGCNVFESKNPASWPIAFWQEGDIWMYIEQKKLNYAKIYDMGEKRTGCIFCCFGIQYEKNENRFERMKKTHPKLWAYCMDKLGFRKVLEYIGVDIENYYEKELFL